MRPARGIVRGLCVAFLGLALLNPTLEGGSAPRCRIYVIDRSDSVILQQRSPGALQDEEILTLIHADSGLLRPEDRAAVVLFGRDPLVLIRPIPGSALRLESFPQGIDGTASRAIPAIESARSLCPEGLVPEVVLFSDGAFVEEPDTIRSTASGLGVSVACVPLGDPLFRDIRVASVRLPPPLREGEPFAVELEVISSRDGEAKVTVGESVQRARLAARRRTLVMVPGLVASREKPLLPFRVEIEGESELVPENSEGTLEIPFQKERPRLLVVGEPDSPGAASARDRFETTVVPEYRSAAGFDAIFLENASLTREQMRQVAGLVRKNGLSLLVTGGSRSYHRHFRGTPLEEILPLWADPDERSLTVFLLDHSGSMGGEVHGRRKWDIAVDALARALEALGPRRETAVITFSGTPAVRLAPSSLEDPSDLVRALRGELPQSGTQVLPALDEAVRILRAHPRGRRQILLVTDGELHSKEQDPTAFRIRRRALNELNCRATVLLTGPDARRRELGELGRMIETPDWNRLPEELARQAEGGQDLFADDVEVRIRQAGRMTEGLQPFRLARIHRVSAKPEALVLADAEAGPVAAYWSRGGSVFAFTFAPGRNPLVSRALEWCAENSARKARIVLEPEGKALRISVELPAEAPVPATATAFVSTPEEEPVRVVLRQEGSRILSGALEIRKPGRYRVWLPEARAQGVAHVVSTHETSRLVSDREALARVGKLVTTQAALSEPIAQRPRRIALRPYLIAAGLVLFLLDLALGVLRPS